MPTSSSYIKLLERIWRNSNNASPAARKTAVEQTYGNKKQSSGASSGKTTVPNGKSPRKTRSKPTRAKKKVSTPQVTKNKARKRGTGRGKAAQGRSFKARAKPSTSANISKFNQGLKGRLGGTTAAISGAAIKAGTVKATLASTLGGGSFLAGLNSIPALALIAANIAVWKNNLRQIGGIYNHSDRYLINQLSLVNRLKSLEPPPKLQGGGNPDAIYSVEYTAEFYSTHSKRTITATRTTHSNIPGSIKSYEAQGQGTQYMRLHVYSNHPSASNPYVITFNGGIGTQFRNVSAAFIPQGETEPDTSPPPKTQPSNYQSPIPSVSKADVQPRSKKRSKPKVNPPSPKQSIPSPESPTVEPTPNPVPAPKIQPGDNTDTEPRTPQSSPVVKTKRTATPAVQKKPKPSRFTKTQKFPTYEESQAIRNVIEQERAKREITISSPDPISGDLENRGQFLKRKNKSLEEAAKKAGFDTDAVPSNRISSSDKVTKITTKVLDTETEVTSDKVPPLFFPKAVETDPKPTNKPKATKVDGCQKGCSGGSSGGLSPSDQDSLNGLSNALQIADLGLLKIINQKLGSQISNGGISGGLSQMTRSLAFDRWLNLLNVALSFHNAMMLSTTVIDTVVAVFDNVLESIGFQFKDVDGTSISFGSVISGSIRSIITRVVPEKTYTAVTSIWTRANRFINASANLLYSVRGVIDAGQDITETIGENVSLIGNALKKAGAVRENAFGWMPERFDHSSRLHRRLEKIGDVADTFEEISGNVLDLSEEIKEMKESAEEFEKVRTEAVDKREKEESNKKRTATTTPKPTEIDEVRGVIKDER